MKIISGITEYDIVCWWDVLKTTELCLKFFIVRNSDELRQYMAVFKTQEEENSLFNKGNEGRYEKEAEGKYEMFTNDTAISASAHYSSLMRCWKLERAHSGGDSDGFGGAESEVF